jgi:hypothetical protein
MKDCRTIRFGALDSFNPLTDKQIPHVSAVVWSRERVLRLYNIPHEMLLAWGIINGNDFTEHFSRDLFRVPELASHSLQHILQFLRTHSELCLGFDWIADPELRIACEYSWAFYELEDLSRFYLPQYLTQSSLDELITEGEELTYVSLTKAHRELIADWVEKQVTGDWRSEKSPISLHNAALNCLRTIRSHVMTQTSSKKRDMRKEDAFGMIEDVHFTGLTELIKRLLRNQVITFDKKLRLPLRWENICVAQLYQLVIRDVHRNIQNQSREHKHIRMEHIGKLEVICLIYLVFLCH